MFNHYLALTKPRISLLFAVTGLTALIIEQSVVHDPVRLWGLVLAIFMVGGAANALNQFFERDVDKQMARTAKKRPLPLGQITPRQALIFSIVTAVIGNGLIYYWGGWLAVAFGVGTIAYYSFYYTLWLKPRTPYNIVIGGAAGGTAPLIAWAAVTGTVGWVPFILFLIIFFWTPPHFWALALCCKEDYKTVSYPMLPLVKGDDETRKQIVLYSILMLPLTMSLYFIGALGMFYLVSSSILSILFLVGSVIVYQRKQIKTYWQFFAYSIIYLFFLFIFMMLDTCLS